jgi:hypothetical protein
LDESKEAKFLSSYLKALVDCSEALGTTETRILADFLSLSDETVNTYWKRIKAALCVKDRFDAVLLVRAGRILSRSAVSGEQK